MIKVKCPVCGHEILDEEAKRWEAEVTYRSEYGCKVNMVPTVVSYLLAIGFFSFFADGGSFAYLLEAVLCVLLGGIRFYRQENKAIAQFKIDHPDMASLLLI